MPRRPDLRGRPRALEKTMPRKDGMKYAALADDATHPDRTSLRFHDPLGERQPQPRSGVLLGQRLIELLELDEESVDVLWLDSNAGVFDLEPKRGGRLGANPHHDAPSFGRELQRVREVVVEHLFEPCGIEHHA